MYSSSNGFYVQYVYMSIYVQIFPFSFTQMELCSTQHIAFFSLGYVSMTIPYQYIFLNGSIV